MHFARQGFDAFRQILGHFRELGILLQQDQQLFAGLFRLGLAFGIGGGQRFAVLRIGVGLGFVAGGLARLGQQDQRRGARPIAG